MRKIVQFMHVSLDGFVAGTQGEMDWITVDDEIFDYAGARTTASDMALYGRVTFEMMDAYWPTAADQPGASKHDLEHSAWYKAVTKVVVSNTMRGTARTDIKVIGKNLREEILALKKSGDKEILIFGSPSAGHALMKEGLVDEFWIFVNPILLGNGTPLFNGIADKVKLRLEHSQPFSSGVVCLHYIVNP